MTSTNELQVGQSYYRHSKISIINAQKNKTWRKEIVFTVLSRRKNIIEIKVDGEVCYIERDTCEGDYYSLDNLSIGSICLIPCSVYVYKTCDLLAQLPTITTEEQKTQFTFLQKGQPVLIIDVATLFVDIFGKKTNLLCVKFLCEEKTWWFHAGDIKNGEIDFGYAGRIMKDFKRQSQLQKKIFDLLGGAG